jgi:hypothetical protein
MYSPTLHFPVISVFLNEDRSSELHELRGLPVIFRCLLVVSSSSPVCAALHYIVFTSVIFCSSRRTGIASDPESEVLDDSL